MRVIDHYKLTMSPSYVLAGGHPPCLVSFVFPGIQGPAGHRERRGVFIYIRLYSGSSFPPGPGSAGSPLWTGPGQPGHIPQVPRAMETGSPGECSHRARRLRPAASCTPSSLLRKWGPSSLSLHTGLSPGTVPQHALWLGPQASLSSGCSVQSWPLPAGHAVERAGWPWHPPFL